MLATAAAGGGPVRDTVSAMPPLVYFAHQASSLHRGLKDSTYLSKPGGGRWGASRVGGWHNRPVNTPGRSAQCRGRVGGLDKERLRLVLGRTSHPLRVCTQNRGSSGRWRKIEVV
jgi:hypothetical protein